MVVYGGDQVYSMLIEGILDKLIVYENSDLLKIKMKNALTM